MSEVPASRPLVSAKQLRVTFVVGTVGALALIVLLLLLASARPQGQLVALDDAAYLQQLQAAEEALTGFELVGDGARISIDHAMQLVVDRGVDLPIYAGGVSPTAQSAAASDLSAQAAADGEALYTQFCMACHQATGMGIPGAFPPLANQVGRLHVADRSYSAYVVLFGIMGPIESGGFTYAGMMPGLAATLTDEEVAAILDYVLTAWGDADELGDAFEPYTADEVAEWRTAALQMTDVHALRLALELP